MCSETPAAPAINAERDAEAAASAPGAVGAAPGQRPTIHDWYPGKYRRGCTHCADMGCDACEVKQQPAPARFRCNGVGRNAEWPKSLLFYFDSVPTDDQMRYLCEVMQRACACMPEDLT